MERDHLDHNPAKATASGLDLGIDSRKIMGGFVRWFGIKLIELMCFLPPDRVNRDLCAMSHIP
jgi:hypothetical protein